MYLPEHFTETDKSVLHALIAKHPLGAWVTFDGGELLVNHVPFLLDASRGELGTLVAHVARANPVWQSFSTDIPSVVVFQGPESYISPSWYPSKAAHGKAVPTWNYAVVHAHGMPRAVDRDPAWMRAHLGKLTDTHEAFQARPWKVSDAPADYVARMVDSVVGIEIAVDRLDGKWKVSQNRSETDRRGVAAGLAATGEAAGLEMAALVTKRGGPPDEAL